MTKVLFFWTFLFVITANAQTDKSKDITFDTPKNIEEQFEYVYKKSGKYREYKVVKRDWLVKLKKQTLDTLKNIANELEIAENKINSQQKVIVKVENDLQNVNEQLALVRGEKDAMPFLGMNTTKRSYAAILWSIVGLLMILLGLFIFKFKQSNVITKEARANLKDLEVEFEEHRRKALEREQKVMRRLQDELNKNN